VSAAAHCKQEFAFTRKSDGAHDVSGICAAGDQRWALINHSVPDMSRQLISVVAWSKQSSAQARAQVPNGRAFNRCLCTG
jgi:hypothetical protein